MSEKTFAEFSETLTLQIPNISEKLIDFSEAKTNSRGLIVEVAAIHAGLTANFNHYGAKALEQSLSSWVSPYPKPIILNHDLSVDPIGRVMAAKMDVEKDGTPFTRLQIAITDPTAIEKIADQRYLTGSVGGRSEAALCSVCGKDWAEATMMGPVPCRHVRGRTYKGQLAYLERLGLGFKEYSFVNNPADSRSQVIDDATQDNSAQISSEQSDGWITAAKFFSLNMDKEEVLEYTESENRDLLKGLRKKESSPLYLSLKGAFLTSLAVAQEMHEDKETFTVSETEIHDVEDVLAVTEELSDDLVGITDLVENADEEDLAQADENSDESLEDSVEDSEVEELAADTDEDSAEDVADPIDASTEDVEAPVSEDGDEDEDENLEEARPQGQEKERSQDADSKFNKPLEKVPSFKIGGDKTREDDESQDGEEEISETELEVQEDENTDFELLVEEMISREEALLEENARLKKALHRMLAERVVDTKIALGVEKVQDRKELVEDHVSRSAASLADTMRDLATSSTQYRPVIAEVPEMDQSDVSITDDGSVIDGESEQSVEVVDPMANAEQLFVDALMGRRKL